MTVGLRPQPDWLDVSREAMLKLGTFLDLVEKWNPKINLVSVASLASAWTRHMLDSAQLLSLVNRPTGVWLDIGSGGGFPGIVVSIIAQESNPDLRVSLVEADRRKAVFLGEAVRKLNLTAKVYCERIENLPPMDAQIISARALAPLESLLPMVSRHLSEGGVALFPKGHSFQMELNAARRNWSMQYEAVPSKTDSDGAILKIWDLHVA